MKIEKYSYGRSYLLPNGDWDKYEVTVSLDEKDNPDNARELTKLMIGDFFCKNNPGIKPVQVIDANGELPVIQVEKETAEDRRIAAHVKDIENCKTLKTLELFKGMLGDSILIKKAFEKKLHQLSE